MLQIPHMQLNCFIGPESGLHLFTIPVIRHGDKENVKVLITEVTDKKTQVNLFD